jgi:hypothetical protein
MKILTQFNISNTFPTGQIYLEHYVDKCLKPRQQDY